MNIYLSNISKSFGFFPALNNISITVPSGKLVALLGPSGSGKTTLLRVIAGLEMPETGQVKFGDVDMTNKPVRNRNVGFVFQHYALFQHMTVAENIAFGLKVRGMKKKNISNRVSELIELMQLNGLDKRQPAELSGGQQQRVALARALAAEPAVLLLDEPFGALDARVRQELRTWLRRLHNEISVTTVFVTHDQEEAFEVADSVVILNNGQVEQIGSTDDIFDKPANAFVMDFIGNVNVLNGHFDGNTSKFGDLMLPNTHDTCDAGSFLTGDASAYIRSEDIVLAKSPNGNPYVSGKVSYMRRIGLAVHLNVDYGNQTLKVQIPYDDWLSLDCEVGSPVVASVKRARVFPYAYH